MEKFPSLINDQVALIRVDDTTGHVLDEDLTLAISDQQKVYTVFSSLHDAEQYAESLVSGNNIECVIYGNNEEFLKRVCEKSEYD